MALQSCPAASQGTPPASLPLRPRAPKMKAPGPGQYTDHFSMGTAYSERRLEKGLKPEFKATTNERELCSSKHLSFPYTAESQSLRERLLFLLCASPAHGTGKQFGKTSAE